MFLNDVHLVTFSSLMLMAHTASKGHDIQLYLFLVQTIGI